MADITPHPPRIAFMGFGEAAEAFASGWAFGPEAAITAFDIKSADPAARDALIARGRANAVACADRLPDAMTGAAVVFSLVTADQALAAAQAAAPSLDPGTLWLDCNSCAPQTKRQAAAVIEGAGGHYVDVAVMAPVHPKRHLVPLLVAGPHAARALEVLAGLGMRPDSAGDQVGDASSIKMIRSVMIKGIEALCAECLLAAQRAGVADAVMTSLAGTYPGIDWPERGAYNLERMLVHGTRRAAEMREVAVTIAGLGIPSRMSAATALWQDQLADLGLDAGPDDFTARADLILSHIGG